MEEEGSNSTIEPCYQCHRDAIGRQHSLEYTPEPIIMCIQLPSSINAISSRSLSLSLVFESGESYLLVGDEAASSRRLEIPIERTIDVKGRQLVPTLFDRPCTSHTIQHGGIDTRYRIGIRSGARQVCSRRVGADDGGGLGLVWVGLYV